MEDEVYFPRSLKRKIFNYTKASSPFESGNVRYNAIRGRKWNDSNEFHILFSIADAYYIEYLEENEMAGGSLTKENKHKGFIAKTFGKISNELDSYFHNNKSFANRRLRKGEGKNNPLREFRHNKSLALYKMQREASR